MDISQLSGAASQGRRRFLGLAAGAVAASGLPLLAAPGAHAATRETPATEAASTSFGPVRQVKAGVLSTGYVEAGPADGQPVILMHGFPYDIHSYAAVAPLLAAEGYRVIVPYFRGYGSTTFLSAATPAQRRPGLVRARHPRPDGRAAHPSGDPGRVRLGVAHRRHHRRPVAAALPGTGVGRRQRRPAAPKAENAWWYQYYFSTERGVRGLTEYRSELGQFIWTFNLPTWNYTAATYDKTAAAFANPDFVAIIIGNYRWRLGLYPAEAEYAGLEKRLQQAPDIAVPAITVDGKYDPFTAAGNGSAYRAKFTGKHDHRVLAVGHNVPQEDPRGFAQAVIDAGHLA